MVKCYTLITKMDKNLKFIKIINRVNAYYFVTKKLM